MLYSFKPFHHARTSLIIIIYHNKLLIKIVAQFKWLHSFYCSAYNVKLSRFTATQFELQWFLILFFFATLKCLYTVTACGCQLSVDSIDNLVFIVCVNILLECCFVSTSEPNDFPINHHWSSDQSGFRQIHKLKN